MALKASHSGLHYWLVQRFSALVIGAYFIFIAAYLLSNWPLDYLQWHALFDNLFVKLVTLVTLVSILCHAWIGLWTVITDYIKVVSLRQAAQWFVIILLLCFFVWGVAILV